MHARDRAKCHICAQATGETCHIIMGHEGKMPYWEGQSYGVIPPGTNPKNGSPLMPMLCRHPDSLTTLLPIGPDYLHCTSCRQA